MRSVSLASSSRDARNRVMISMATFLCGKNDWSMCTKSFFARKFLRIEIKLLPSIFNWKKKRETSFPDPELWIDQLNGKNIHVMTIIPVRNSVSVCLGFIPLMCVTIHPYMQAPIVIINNGNQYVVRNCRMVEKCIKFIGRCIWCCLFLLCQLYIPPVQW